MRENQILLAMKKRGFGAGKWNGVGGKIEPGETPEQAIARECQEEINVTPEKLLKVGEIDFLQPINGQLSSMFVHVFTTTVWVGEPSESEEMNPAWYEIEKIPYSDMWPDDEYWMPLLIEGALFKASFELNDKDEIVQHSIAPVDTLGQ